jgi:HJR/Mrr/RecB family endonuclease
MLREQSFDLVLDGLLTHKRSLSRQIVVPSCMSQRELAELLAQVASSGLAQDKELLRALDAKDWRSFELWVAGRFQAAGWQVSDTPLSGDGCADVIARHPRGGRHAIIQIKHRSSEIGTVDEGAVKEVLRAPDNYRRSHPWLVQPEQPVLLAISNGAFELAARTLAAQRGVRIVDRAEIVGLEGIARELIAAGRI